MLSSTLLRSIRNELPMSFAIARLDREGPYSKVVEGYFRFECPHCREIRATVNPKNNLAHCFSCQKNTNNIDLMLSLGYDFLGAVSILQDWLEVYRAQSRPACANTADRPDASEP